MSDMDLEFPPVDHTQWDEMVTCLRATGTQLYIVSTGATGGLLSALWRVPGASKNLLGFRFCYANEELVDFLGKQPDGSFCSDETAAKMAAHAYWHGRELAYRRGVADLNSVVGVGMTAAVTTDRDHRGADKVSIAVKTHGTLFTFDATFPKPESIEFLDRQRYRHWQGEMCDMLTLNAILSTLGMAQIGISNPTNRGWRMESNQLSASIPGIAFSKWRPDRKPYRFHHAQIQRDHRFDSIYGWINWDQKPSCDDESLGEEWRYVTNDNADQIVLYPGSFAPLTHGHIGVAKMIEQMTGKHVVFELTNTHPNKGRMSDEDMLWRADQFTAFAPVVLSDNAPLYVDKARCYPGVPMVVGADALKQLLDERHYGGYQGLRNALDEFVALGTTFYVVGRKVENNFLTLNDIPIMAKYRHLFHDVSFRKDISSTELRNRAGQA
ncbi:hypothetical protein A2318_00270 [Candidatus Uhrbacteria bacterium RIFOXYB2_FULL_45_11]|uniref:Cytidyltransferase-like domain-containing protein n=1 Tax=Candidatus Uhrbacteria bacterium RIFOXYB2_FULL_45_11 TaxID=1802421 RepID=A0A1F7W7D1_9BACT|nr:MAG: hypothetical protein A2318_00270 [Candidatus Uhrbacteria bacterium RIFOXYB2_FULL_45_11]